MQRFTAAWVLPVSGAPIRQGAVLVGADGRIVAVGDQRELLPGDSIEEVRLGDAVLMPGLVNTHTHLELTGFAGKVNAEDFWDWITQVIAVKAARSEQAFFDAACDGIRQMWSAGVTTVCDTGSTGAVIAALDHLGASGSYHHEVFGAHPDECAGAMVRFGHDLDRLSRHATGRVGLGVSPHAPYTVSGRLYAASAELARAHGVDMAVHVAEPAGERALLEDFTGIFADSWRARGIPRPTVQPVSPVAWLDRHGVISDRTLCVHAIDVRSDDADLIAQRGAAVAHCPRSNRHHHGADAPVRAYLDRGIRLGLGTDSEISVDPPDLLAEAREARKLTGWSTAEAVRALTLGGAEAIGRGTECGSLESGKWADLCAIRIAGGEHPEPAVLAANRGQVVATWLAGREVHRVTGV
ncbi:MAG TPA: amidohydrolase family protein [Gemmatimonadales bacterium]|nr:amidohydrolase family protein [Gemmatimonadales bacterium]